MNANSKLPAPTTAKRWLEQATAKLQDSGIPSARLDAELLLADALGKDRTWLIAHQDEDISETMIDRLDRNLARRATREPLAYIRGYKEFYGRNFTVTPDTLIPRPETETLVEELLKLPLPTAPTIHDVGTGSGCIPITIALELPEARVSGSDISHTALEVARQNATKLRADVAFYKDDLLERTSESFDAITANLPYVDRTWGVSTETHTEPDLALYAEDGGLALIKKLIEQVSSQRLQPSGYLLLEADPRQHDAITTLAPSHGLRHYQTNDFIVVLQKN